MEMNVDSKSFKKAVLQSDLPVLVDFWAPWCAPCRMVAPTLTQIAKEYEGKFHVAKVDVDVSPDIAGQYNVTGIPTMALFKDGKMVERIVGAYPKQQIVNTVMAHVAVKA